MEEVLAQAMVSALLFLAVYLIGKRATMNHADGEDGDGNEGGDAEGTPRSRMFSIEGRQLVGAAVVAGLASIGAQFLLTAKLRPAATIFMQDAPF
jgi:hypothetical protein